MNLSFSFIDHMNRLGIPYIYWCVQCFVCAVIMVVKCINVSVHAIIMFQAVIAVALHVAIAAMNDVALVFIIVDALLKICRCQIGWVRWVCQQFAFMRLNRFLGHISGHYRTGNKVYVFWGIHSSIYFWTFSIKWKVLHCS